MIPTPPAAVPCVDAAPELRPCPFCGSDAFVQGESAMFFASCLKCYCCVGEAYDRDAMPEHVFRSEEEAIAAWNLRTDADLATARAEGAAAWDAGREAGAKELDEHLRAANSTISASAYYSTEEREAVLHALGVVAVVSADIRALPLPPAASAALAAFVAMAREEERAACAGIADAQADETQIRLSRRRKAASDEYASTLETAISEARSIAVAIRARTTA